ncbi:MAG: hypothetical protein AAGC71_00175 [Pseudomonadota bacterium]
MSKWWRPIVAGVVLGSAVLVLTMLWPQTVPLVKSSSVVTLPAPHDDPVTQLLADLDASRSGRYARMDSRSLQALAWADPLAAVVLAERWAERSPKAASQLILRAASDLDDARLLRWWLERHPQSPTVQQRLEQTRQWPQNTH